MEGSPEKSGTKRVKIKIAQHNCRGSNDVFITLFHIVKNFDISFVCVQDPPLYNGEPLRAPGYECVFQKTRKVRACTYVSLRVLLEVSFVIFPCVEDVLFLRVFAKEGRLLGQSRSIGIANVYNRQGADGHSAPAESIFPETPEPTLVVGDLNIHTSLTDPMRVLSSSERRTGEAYMRTAALHSYTILNTPGIYTRFPDNPNLHRPSTIDYTLANASMFTKVNRWRDITQRTGSDHIVIVTEIDSEEVELARPAPDWEKIKWRTDKGEPNPDIKAALDDYYGEEWGYVPIENAAEAEENFQESLRRLIHLARSWAPIKRPSLWSKAW